MQLRQIDEQIEERMDKSRRQKEMHPRRRIDKINKKGCEKQIEKTTQKIRYQKPDVNSDAMLKIRYQ